MLKYTETPRNTETFFTKFAKFEDPIVVRGLSDFVSIHTRLAEENMAYFQKTYWLLWMFKKNWKLIWNKIWIISSINLNLLNETRLDIFCSISQSATRVMVEHASSHQSIYVDQGVQSGTWIRLITTPFLLNKWTCNSLKKWFYFILLTCSSEFCHSINIICLMESTKTSVLDVFQ